ncbi:MAG: M67 family metallopeptidase [Bacteroidales bacterium]
MIQIPKNIIEGIIHQALKELPNEACGLLTGKNGVVEKRYAMINVDFSPSHFSFNPAEQFQVFRSALADGTQIIANYHSHPESPARPSKEDIRLAFDPEITYLILSLASEKPVLKAFNIKDGVSEEVEIITTDKSADL